MKKGAKVVPRYQAFSNGTEFMWWQGHNCDRCVKASHYNPKTDEFTKYRCQIQCDIEMASVQEGLVTKRVYDIVQQPTCKYLQTDRKRRRTRSKAMRNYPKLFDDEKLF